MPVCTKCHEDKPVDRFTKVRVTTKRPSGHRAQCKDCTNAKLRGEHLGPLPSVPHPPGICAVNGCGKPHLAKGYCRLHYKRYHATGSPDENERSLTRFRVGEGKKLCPSCNEILDLEDFYLNASTAAGKGRQGACKKCCRSRHLVRTYGLTPEAFTALLNDQNGVCGICKNEEIVTQNGTLQRLSVDHDHDTGKVRGLLCRSCNAGIGHLKDNVELLKEAINYLERNLNA